MSQTTTPAPKFSVVMPVYNSAAYVGQAIESVIHQRAGDWELILVDDGSTDGSESLVDEYAARDARITAVHQPNAGPAAARNAGLARCRGEWMTYIDSDDVWFPEALELYSNYLTSHGEAKFIYGYRHRLSADGTITELPGEFQDRPTGSAELFQRMYLSHLCVCYRRELLDLAGRYDENLRTCEDYDLYLRLSLHCRFEPIARATGVKRRHEANISRQSGPGRMREAEVLRRFVERRGGRDVIEPAVVSRRLGRLYYSSAKQYFKAGCFSQAVEAANLAHRYRRTVKSTAISLLARCLRPLTKRGPIEMPRL